MRLQESLLKIHLSYLRTPELHISIFIKQQQQARRALPRPGRSEREKECVLTATLQQYFKMISVNMPLQQLPQLSSMR